MMSETNFNAIKSEILNRAKKAHACTEQYGRAYKSENLNELLSVVKDNFWWATSHKVLTVELIDRFRTDFSEYGIYANISASEGFVLADNATVRAWGNATVRASDNATVRACGNATVRASDNATVEASDNATVEASDNAYCSSYSIIECEIKDNAIYRVRLTNQIFFASDNIKFIKSWNCK